MQTREITFYHKNTNWTLLEYQSDGAIFSNRRYNIPSWTLKLVNKSDTLYPRFSEKAINEALKDTPVVLINGPRQAGKTTLARSIVGKDWIYLTLDDKAIREAAVRDPNGFIQKLDNPAIIDEIQHVPDLLPAIKLSVDEDRRPGRFLLTGSANIMMLPTVSESLAGRIEVVTLYPLGRSELIDNSPRFLKNIFKTEMTSPIETCSTEDVLQLAIDGGFPEVLSRTSDERKSKWHKSYADALIRRDIKTIAHLQKLALFDLLHVLAEYSGKLMNYSDVGAKLDLNHKTAEHYISIFEQLFITNRLRAWHRNGLKRLVKAPKLHFIDSGFMSSVLAMNMDVIQENYMLAGSLLETFVYSELIKQASWVEDDINIYHYRDKDKVEVDFVLENARKAVVGIEVKSSSTVTRKDFQGLERLNAACSKHFKAGVVIYNGEHILPFGDKLFAIPFACLWS